ncbi:FecR domain-containing protein [uncultured Sphingomonas sp.]|uniref:FecR family protein n=1 Tax=uncultured Sphingomonas sp. TaxID=158754 RepID=UPI00260D2992|nr:FecR domain-containing protein [uncultured Sphingomonas sp.]
MTDNDGKAEAQAEAAQWYARLKTLPVSLKTLDEFFVWRRQPGNVDAFLAVEELYDTTGRLAERSSIQAATDAAYQRGLVRGRRGPNRVALASGLVALLVAGGVLFTSWYGRDQSLTTGVGETREVALSDGSIVELDTDSALTTHFTHDARHVRLTRGQAYFTVAHNAELPFIVDAGSASVTATGTQFDVRRAGDQTVVTLVQGGVDIRSGNSLSHLTSGQKLRVVPGQKLVPETVDTASSTAWTRGRLVLDGVPLSQAIDEVNRYADHPVRLDDPSYAEVRFSGTLTTGDVAAFVAAVTAILPLKSVTERNGSVHLIG